MLAPSDEEAKERCMEVYREEKRKVKRYIYIRAKNKINVVENAGSLSRSAAEKVN